MSNETSRGARRHCATVWHWRSRRSKKCWVNQQRRWDPRFKNVYSFLLLFLFALKSHTYFEWRNIQFVFWIRMQLTKFLFSLFVNQQNISSENSVNHEASVFRIIIRNKNLFRCNNKQLKWWNENGVERSLNKQIWSTWLAYISLNRHKKEMRKF